MTHGSNSESYFEVVLSNISVSVENKRQFGCWAVLCQSVPDKAIFVKGAGPVSLSLPKKLSE